MHPILANSRILIHLLTIVLLLQGCGISKSFQFAPGVTRIPDQPIGIGAIDNAAGSEIPFDYEPYFRNALKSALLKNHITYDEIEDAKLVLDVKILEYQAGDAFKRWLWPGYGKTICFVRAKINDRASNQQLAVVNVRRSIAYGGLYTVGAYKYVFDNVADAVADELKEHR